MEYKLQQLSPDDGHEIFEMLQQLPEEENGFMNSFNGLSYEDYKQELRVRDEESQGINLQSDRVPQTLFWFMADAKPVGVLKIRHYLNEHLKAHGGHIGYAVIPSERGKGYASKMLELSLPEAGKLGIRDVLITCNVDNLASRRVAEKNGGRLEKQTPESCFYWIHINS